MSKSEYKKFIEAVFAGVEFDENAASKDLLKVSQRFEALRRTWVAGEQYEPSPALHDLVCVFFGAYAKRQSSDLCLEVERALELLSQFCLEQSRASRRRLRGSIEQAMHYKAAAERIYRQLPAAWKW